VDAAKLIQAAIDQSHEIFTLDEVADEIEAGRSTAFVGERSIMVCTLQKHHDEITGHAWLAGGDLDELRDVLRPQAEGWARANGASHTTIDGRRGWIRALKDNGYGEVAVTLRKRI